ncbi:hypothetical protein H7X65_03525 [Candidatus Parcubacteria bacterium]|nr:hypothetical protein [Candidatus Parcubacteria bacterium]
MNITNARLMAVSGTAGFLFFAISNFIHIFVGLNVVTAILQIAINIFVFVTWGRGFQKIVEIEKDNVGPFKMVLIALIEILVNVVDFLTRQETFKGSLLSKGFVSACGVMVPLILGSITIVRVIVPFLQQFALSLL